LVIKTLEEYTIDQSKLYDELQMRARDRKEENGRDREKQVARAPVCG
jgi:predicted transposase YdaD